MTRLVPMPGLEKLTVRGRNRRKSNLKELFQEGVISSIASAAGCAVTPDPLDTGIDVVVTHEISGLTDRRTINLQLKCTEVGDPRDEFVRVKVTKTRYDEYRSHGKHEPLILVAQVISPEQDDWVNHADQFTHFSARNYWLNPTGLQASKVADGGDVTVEVPTKNVFDDAALVRLFAEHRQGVLPL